MNLIIITFVSVKAKFLPMQPLGPPLNAKEIVFWCCLHSYFSHLSGINSKGFSNTEGLWKEAIQFPVTKVPFFIGTPNIVISSSKLLSNSPPEEGNNLEVYVSTQSKYWSFFIFSTVMSESDKITEFIYALNFSAISGFWNTKRIMAVR